MKYNGGVRRFFKYCEARNLDTIPTESSLCHFISEISREIRPSSVNSYLTGIVHFFDNSHPTVREARMSKRVRDTLKGYMRSLSKPSKRENAMTCTDLRITSDFFCLSFNDLLFNTILGIGFQGLHRIGELVESDAAALKDDRKLVKRWSLSFNMEDSYATYTLPHSKTDSIFSGTPVVIPGNGRKHICAFQTLLRYTGIRDEAFPTNPFLLLRANGSIPTRSWFTNWL